MWEPPQESAKFPAFILNGWHPTKILNDTPNWFFGPKVRENTATFHQNLCERSSRPAVPAPPKSQEFNLL